MAFFGAIWPFSRVDLAFFAYDNLATLVTHSRRAAQTLWCANDICSDVAVRNIKNAIMACLRRAEAYTYITQDSQPYFICTYVKEDS